MKVKKSTLQNTIIVICLIVVALFIFWPRSSDPTSAFSADNTTTATSNENQVLIMNAKAGFNPNVLTAKADTNTTLRVKTNNTFDCSASIRIPSLNISKTLPFSGDTDFNLGAFKAGTVVSGTCGMGMYSFQIKFS